jgi:hypothetical protein
MSYEDRGGTAQDTKRDVDERDNVLFSILNVFGWIVSIVGIVTLTFSLAALGSPDGILAVASSFSAVLFGVLLIAAAAVVKSTAETARNTKRMLDLMRQ